MTRETFIVGNWKMYKSIAEAKEFVHVLRKHLKSSQKIYLAVPYTTIHSLAIEVKDTGIVIGAQNLHQAKEGAFTGEISGLMLKEAGADFVLVGHSERRHVFQESSQLVHQKLLAALSFSLRPIVCVGEKKEEREAGQTEEILKQQLEESLGVLTLEQLKHVVIAYEPVWAIGTGLTATPEMAEQAHQFCREVISHKWGYEAADQISILYGGSVKVDNSESLLSQTNIDGLLIGGASLDPENLSKIISKI